MKFFLSIFLTIIFYPTIFSQQTNLKENIGDEPYPAPVMYNNVSVKEAAFIGLFENTNVTNLHLYPDVKGDDKYHYKGKIINASFSKFLPSEIAQKTYVKGSEPRAVFSIRGDGEELYILRLPNNKQDNELALYSMNNGQLLKVKSLASYTCKRNRCTQVDSWLTDVDGDMRIDIIQKRKIIKKNKKEKVKSYIYLMDQSGHFDRTRKLNIDLDEYQMQTIW